ncbi:hypothetical protein H671_1g2896 [Cricetulus griseus]|nr:hypothetical protein H671_1g2896 [Cricetulus griseus]
MLSGDNARDCSWLRRETLLSAALWHHVVSELGGGGKAPLVASRTTRLSSVLISPVPYWGRGDKGVTIDT